MTLNVRKIADDAITPTRGSKEAAGYDLYAYIPEGTKKIYPGCMAKISTGISVALPGCTFGAIYPRSGLASKHGMRLANCVGVIDSDYRGEVMVAMFNDSGNAYTINNGDRIAQLIVQPYCPINIQVVNELDETERGAGGFGSSGIN